MITWVTKNDLGVVSEDFNTAITLVATNSGSAAIIYTLTNGRFPLGLALSSTGVITGLAQNTTANTVYKFTVRASAVDSGVTVIEDRTFTLQVQGEHVPVITTTTKNLGNVFTGEYFNFRFRAVDLDLEDTVKFYISSGRIPIGLALATDGTLSGTVAPILGATAQTYNFRIAASDSKNTVYAPYQLTVLNRSANTADNRSYLASSTILKSDAGVVLVPVILNTNFDLGIHRSDDRYSHKISAFTFDNSAVTFSIESGALPPNLTLHSNTGWIEGYLPTQSPPGLITYTFAVAATSVVTNLKSLAKTFTISIDSVGATQQSGWNVGPNLGRMRLGDVSILDVNPHNAGSTVTFRLQAGSALPANLQLKENGLITGRLAFDGVLAQNVTTVNYKFTVEMYNSVGTVIATKTFDLDIDYQAAYETLYLQVFPKQSHRDLYESIMQNTAIIPTDKVFRIDDSYFGITKQFKMLAITGLTPTQAAAYIADSSLNHRRKQSYIKEIKWATAKDRNSRSVYEVVYAVLKDREENEADVSAPIVKKLGAASRADITADNSLTNVSTGIFNTNVGTSITASQGSGIKSYPPSYDNMRTQIYSKIALSSTSALPFWLSTLQASGETLADHNVIPLVYVKLGQAAAVVANIVNAGIDFSTIPFDIDGYVWENYQYTGPKLTNKLSGITPVGISTGNSYLVGSSSETVTIPGLDNMFVNYVTIQNNFPTSGNCCPQLYAYGDVDVSGSTLYTYAIVYKVASGYTHPNFMYRYEYNGSTYVTEVGVHDTAKRVHLGDGWYWAWNTFITRPETTKLVNTSFWYYRYSTELDKVTVAKILMIEDDYTTAHPKYWPIMGVVTPKFQFENGGFESGKLVDSSTTATTPGWTIYKSEIRLGGINTILGFPTPVDPTPTPTGSGNRVSLGDNAAVNKMTFTAALVSDSPPVGTSKKSLRLISNGSTSVGYAVVRGPYAVNNNAVDLVQGDIIEFWWKAQGGSDAYDIFAYLLNTSNGQTITLLNDTGKSTGATTKWAKESRTIAAGEAGTYKFVFVSGTFDYTGGKIIGASLYIDEVNVIKAQPTTDITSVVDVTTKYLKFTGPGQWPWTPNRGVLE
jgi:hypothetical protein